MYKTQIEKSALKFLQKLPQKDKSKIIEAIEQLAQDPHDKRLDTKKLINRPYFRLRVRTYRVIYDIIDSELVVLVVDIGNRGDIYKGL